MLPVLHLNGYKINNPTILARISHDELEALFIGYGYIPYFVEGSDPPSMHQAMAATLEHCVLEIRKIQEEARSTGRAFRPRWPMIILRSPKGWTAPREVDGHYLEGFWRAHQVPLPDIATNPSQLQVLEKWMRSYKPEELFDANGSLLPELKAMAPKGLRRMSANPVANGGVLRKPLVYARFSRNPPSRSRSPARRWRETSPSSAISCARSCGRTCKISAYSGPTRRSPTGCRPSTRSPRKHGWRSIFRRMPTAAISRRTAASWRCSASILPDVKVRFVNVVDLAKLVPNTEHAHGLTDRDFEALFTPDKPVVFNFHGYPWLIHRLTYRRPAQHNIHVRGYKEHGNINTPLELAIRNQTDRFSLAIDAIDRMPRFRATGSSAREALLNQQIACRNHAYEFGIDPPEITNWQWPF